MIAAPVDSNLRGFPAIVVSIVLAMSGICAAQGADEHDAVDYETAPADDPVARLQKRLETGELKLEHNDRNGYLDSVLKLLDIPVSSQSLVFSKTSFQRDRISPTSPRALYFDDNTYVGWTRGGDVLELAATDPKAGTIFYTLDQRKPSGGGGGAERGGQPPAFVRQTHACLQCHGSAMTRDVAGLLVRSEAPASRCCRRALTSRPSRARGPSVGAGGMSPARTTTSATWATPW
jgi:hypothetical protein